jgi:hypothetical protein
MDRRPPKIMLISSIWSSLLGSARRCSPWCGSCATCGAGIFLRSKKVLHSSRSCPTVRWISHHFSALSGWWNNFSFCSVGCHWGCPRFLWLPRSPWSVVLTSRSSYCFFLGGPLLCDSRSWTRASEALMQMSTIISRSATILGFFMAISSMVLISLTQLQKALMTSMS